MQTLQISATQRRYTPGFVALDYAKRIGAVMCAIRRPRGNLGEGPWSGVQSGCTMRRGFDRAQGCHPQDACTPTDLRTGYRAI